MASFPLFSARCIPIKCALLTILSLLTITTSEAAPGSLDPTFGTGGLTTTSIDTSHDDANAMAVLPDGKILVAGRTIKASMDFALLRYDSNGSLDNSFGSGGIVTTDFFAGDDTANAIAVLPDGSIILAGRASGDFLVARYTANGVLDTGFATGNGYLLVDPSSAGNNTCHGLAITPTGKIVLAGNADFITHTEFTVVQINADGTIDTDFGGGDGIVTINPGSSTSTGRAIAVQPDGKILVAGDSGTTGSSSTFDFTLLRLNANGSLDNTFGTGTGIATTDIGGFADIGHAIALQVDGSIVVAGQAFIADSAVDFALVRYLPDGSLDASFGNGGRVTTPVSPTNDGDNKARTIVIQPDEKIIVAGFSNPVPANPDIDDFALARYNKNGSLDSGFGTGGIVTTPIGGNSWESETGYALAIHPDGKVLLVESNTGVTSPVPREIWLAGYLAMDSDSDPNTAEPWDVTPAAFSFTDITGATTSSTQTPASITVSGLGTGIYVPVTITGGEYLILPGSTYSSNIGYVTNGNQISVRHTSSSSISTQTNTVLTIGGVHAPNNTTLIPGTRTSDTFSSTTDDLVPNSFSFTPQTGVTTSTDITSNSITVSGVAAATAISVSGGSYSINGGSYTSSAGTVVNGNTVTVRHTSSASASTVTSTTLTIGGISDTFTSRTADDVTPDAFSFTDQTAVATSTLIESASITVAGITAATAITVTHGEYSVNGGSYTSSAGSVVNGNTVRVRHTSAATASTAMNTTLTIGGVSDIFTTTTADDVTPDAFIFTDVTNVAHSTQMTSNSFNVAGITAATAISVSGTGGTYSINGAPYTSLSGTVINSDSVTVRHMSSGTDSTAVATTLTIGGVADTFSSTTSDLTPAAFSFTDQTNVGHGATMTSNAMTVTGITAATAISVSGTGGTYSINGGTYTSNAGTVVSGDNVMVRHTSSAADSTAVNTTLTIGGVADTFTTTTSNLTPAGFTFTDQSNVAHDVTMTSNAISVTGVTAATVISVSGGTYSINNGATYTSAPGTVVNGNTVTVRHTSSANDSTAVSTTLTIGGVADTFTSTTSDLTPVAFSFTDQTNVDHGAAMTSNTISVTGITAATAISVSGTGGAYSINGGTYTSLSGTVINSDSVTVRHTSSGTDSTAVATTLTIGGVADTFTSTTSDLTPVAFSFTDQTNVGHGASMTSNAVSVTGITTATPISVTGGTYSIDNGATYTSAPGTVVNGNTVTVRHTSSGADSTAVNTTLTIGDVSDTFTSTTTDLTPADFTFIDQTNVAHNTQMTSNTINVSSITVAAGISVSGGSYSINGGTYTSAPGTVVSGNTVNVRHTSSTSDANTVNTTLTMGGVSDTFSTTTSDLTPAGFSFTDQTAVTASTLIESDSITVAGITAATTIAVINGEYSVNGGSYTSSAGVVLNGNTVSVRHSSAATGSSVVNTELTIGGITDTFSSTTDDDATPDAFSFRSQTSVTQLALIESESITITGISVPVTITVSDGSTYEINNTGSTNNPGVVTNGDQIVLRHVAASTPDTSYETIITIGGISGTFTSTTAAATPPAQTGGDGGGGAINFLWIMGFAATLVVSRRKKLVA